MSWNAGSLTADRNLELNTWLDTAEGRRVGLVAVQETHWRGPLEYVTVRFAALHCGETRPRGWFTPSSVYISISTSADTAL